VIAVPKKPVLHAILIALEDIVHIVGKDGELES